MSRLDDLYVEDTGGGGGEAAVVFSHGLLWSSEMYRSQIECFRDERRCVAYDHRGQGRSKVPDGDSVAIDALAEDAAALIESLGPGPVHFVGLSMGGFVGIRLAARRPDLVRTLTLLSTTAAAEAGEHVKRYRRLNAIARRGGLSFITRRVMPIMFGRSFLRSHDRRRERRVFCRALKANKRSIYKAVNGVIDRPAVVDELHAIRCPTLILHGDEDRAIETQRAELTHSGIADSTFVRVPRAGHMINLERPDLVNAALRVFWARAGR